MYTDIELKIFELHKNGLSYTQIAKELNITRASVCYRLNKRFEDVVKRRKEQEDKWKEFENNVLNVIPYCNSLNHVCDELGYKAVNYYYVKIKEIIKKHNVNTDHFGKIKFRHNMYIPDEEYFSENCKHSGANLLQRLLKSGYKEQRCENPLCGRTEWNGQPIPLQVHHINGNHCDNRLENLQLLCPNCHVQTDNYAGRNKKGNLENNVSEKVKAVKIIKNNVTKNTGLLKFKEKRYCLKCGKELESSQKKFCSLDCLHKHTRKNITKEEIIEKYNTYGSLLGTAKSFGISDNGLKKIMKRLDIYDYLMRKQ